MHMCRQPLLTLCKITWYSSIDDTQDKMLTERQIAREYARFVRYKRPPLEPTGPYKDKDCRWIVCLLNSRTTPSAKVLVHHVPKKRLNLLGVEKWLEAWNKERQKQRDEHVKHAQRTKLISLEGAAPLLSEKQLRLKDLPSYVNPYPQLTPLKALLTRKRRSPLPWHLVLAVEGFPDYAHAVAFGNQQKIAHHAFLRAYRIRSHSVASRADSLYKLITENTFRLDPYSPPIPLTVHISGRSEWGKYMKDLLSQKPHELLNVKADKSYVDFDQIALNAFLALSGRS